MGTSVLESTCFSVSARSTKHSSGLEIAWSLRRIVRLRDVLTLLRFDVGVECTQLQHRRIVFTMESRLFSWSFVKP